MSDAIASVLSQIRSLQQQQAGLRVPEVAPAPPRGPSFSETLQNTLRQVNEVQMESRKLSEAFERGDPAVDLVKVMIASQQSQMALRATVEVRNRLVQAYQDVMNMPL